MRVLVVGNRRSGRGGAESVCLEAVATLVRAGHEVMLTVSEEPPPADFSPEVVVVAGGDGSVHHLLPTLADSGIPVYHLPLGTANLFARQFGMGRSVGMLARALSAWRTRDIDLIEFNGRLAAVMVSLGPDAAVVHRVARRRAGPIRAASYVGPLLAELRGWSGGPVRVEADGRTVVEDGRGVLVLANMRHYGGRFDPARRADPQDGVLDVAFLPARTPTDLVRMAALARLGLHERARGVVMTRARTVRVEAAGVPAQADGEAVEHGGGMDVRVRERALRVLLPGERADRPL